MDIASALCAIKHCNNSYVTVAIDSVHFLHPAMVNDVVSIQSTVIKASNTSMEVEVVVQTQDRTPKRLCCFAFITFVALDKNMEKTMLTQLRRVWTNGRNRNAVKKTR
jgi:acyl-CoA hydrolase